MTMIPDDMPKHPWTRETPLTCPVNWVPVTLLAFKGRTDEGYKEVGVHLSYPVRMMGGMEGHQNHTVTTTAN